MSAMMRRGLLAALVMAGSAVGALAQHTVGALRGFPTPEAAADALTDAARRGDDKAMEAILGRWWHALMPLGGASFKRDLSAYLAAWDKRHRVTIDPRSDGARAIVEVGTTGWTLPIPIVKDGSDWRFDAGAGAKEVAARRLGRNEFGAIQTLLAIGDAQRDYAVMDPMKTGATAYARRLLSSPGRKDGLYWPSVPGQPASPLGAHVAQSQVDGKVPGDQYGYNFRLLYGQGPAAPGGARDYIVNGRMIGGFGAIAWPAQYGESGIMTFIMNHAGVVYEQDLGPSTAQRAASIVAFNPDAGWRKADLTPP
jgi:hypothetical protein